jgi:hypothetical protein
MAPRIGIHLQQHPNPPIAAIGQTPFFLLHGYHPCSPATSNDPLSRGVKHLVHNVDANDFIQELTAVRESARDALAIAQSKQAEYYNKGRQIEELEEGDEVLVSPHSLELVDVQGTGRKLVQRHIGPFRVSEKINDMVFRIEIPPEYHMHPIINQEHLTKYHQCDSNLGGDTLPEIRPTSQEEVYEVERIVGHKKVGKKGVLYKV